ncbi:MAG: polysaccharide pyruvyl transferase family protein [Oscillospiraceae bacterium]|nr:polysaccharide pyruvyl transferase family protein [Oscillospiraceae bacterium]
MRNIIIAGGGLVNKGAQAMTLISICELKKRFPNHRMILLTWDASPAAKEKHVMYDLDLLEVPPLKFSRTARNSLLRTAYSLRYRNVFWYGDNIYRHTDLFVDISGYALGSNWDAKVCNDYLDAIEHALAYGIPVYLMPQSFGPFDYQDEAGKAIDKRTRRLFPQVKHIFAREQEGYDALISRYGLSNVTLTHDMVLASKIEDYSPALREKPVFELPTIPENSMGLIPNVRVGDSGVNDPLTVYTAAVRAALEQGLNVFITYHSSQDRELCGAIKAAFADEEKVVLLDRDHSCMEFNELVKKFRFLAASRFHSIVHALKNGVPCVALGWATKYMDLMKLFSQEQYVFDLRKPLDADQVSQAVTRMTDCWQQESKTICAALPQLQKENVFDTIKKA